jgi:GAF domain-containing protein
MLYELTQDLGNSLSLQEALAFVGVRLKRLIPYETSPSISGATKADSGVCQRRKSAAVHSLEIPVGQGLSGWVAENNKPILNGNPSVEAGYLNDPTKYSTLRSALAVPLTASTVVLGVLALYRADRDAFSKENLRILQAISSKVALAIENALSSAAARDLDHDRLPDQSAQRAVAVPLARSRGLARAAQRTLRSRWWSAISMDSNR